MPFGIIVAALALLTAAVLYFVFLPHIEGPPLDKQRADRREILVRCPNCQTWQAAEPVASTSNDLDQSGSIEETNWYRCQHCDFRWSEKQER